MNHIPEINFYAFSEELEKIAFAGAVWRGAKGIGSAIRRGWSLEGAKWLGKGKMTKYLPVGEKALTVGIPAAEATSIIASKKKDPEGRSKIQRLSRVGGGALGGLAGWGAVRKGGWVKRMGASMLGSMAGEAATSAPWKLKKRKNLPNVASSNVPGAVK